MTKKFGCVVYSGDYAVNFASNSVDLYSYFSSNDYTRFFPQLAFGHLVDDSWHYVDYEDDDARVLKFDERGFQARFPWSLMQQGETVLYLGYPLIEAQRQRQGEVTVPCAAVSLQDRGCLLLGKEGAGKTSTAIHLCRGQGARLIGNGLCLVRYDGHQAWLTGGTMSFHVRRVSAARSFPHVLPAFETTEIDPWLDKVFLPPADVGVECTNETSPLTDVFIVHIDEEQSELRVQHLTDISTWLVLNELTSRYIRATASCMLGGEGEEIDLLEYIPSLDTPKLFAMRRALMKHLFNQLGIYYLSGPSRVVAETIANWSPSLHTSASSIPGERRP
jgi:hypothetical protein